MMLVAEPVGWTLEFPDIQAVRLAAGRASEHNESVARLERLGLESEFGELPPVVHLHRPALRFATAIFDFHHEERMRVDELEVRHDPFDGDQMTVVVDAGDRMMGLYNGAGVSDTRTVLRMAAPAASRTPRMRILYGSYNRCAAADPAL